MLLLWHRESESAIRFQNTLDFLTTQTAPVGKKPEGYHFPPKSNSPRTTEEVWQRHWDIAGAYLGTDATLEEIGQAQNLTRERVRQITTKVVRTLYEHSDTVYPYEALGFDKSSYTESINSRYIRKSKIAGGVETLADQGKDAQEIKTVLGINHVQLSNLRVRFRSLGVYVPYGEKGRDPNYKEKVERFRLGVLTDSEMQEFFDNATYATVRNLLKEESPSIVFITDVMKKAGLVFHLGEAGLAYEVIKRGEIPAGMIELKPHRMKGKMRKSHYYFVYTGHFDRALAILKTDPSFDRLRVSRVVNLGNPEATLPTALQLRFTDEYQSLKQVFANLGYNRPYLSLKRTIAQIIGHDCPVGVFKYGTVYCVKPEDQDALQEYLARRIQEIQGEIS